ncbi:helix-turn-helix domain-containing protein [Nocardia spumae]|uniref:helix-turn-helix domain-containing protein n=1 Tax=Nocardia spumae TaxID=2887190 RepID=UPI001D1599F2|nr:helix-turn-helix transcriptional regulator [Nocardia spumae]
MTTVAQPGPFARELRRWRGLRHWSQLDLAIRADTTQRYLSYLEQGRSQPGRAIVLRLAESLQLSLRERNALLATAGYTPAFDESGFDAPQLAPVRAALRSVLDGHMPYPALIADRYGDLVESNAAFDLFTADCAPELLIPPINVRRLALHPKGLAPRVANFAEWGRHVTESMRTRNRISPDPVAEELVAEFETYLPVIDPGPGYVGFAVPLRLRDDAGELRLITTLTSFATATDVSLAELHLEAFLPADEATAELLRRRAEARAHDDGNHRTGSKSIRPSSVSA